jgi:hypothetical protein
MGPSARLRTVRTVRTSPALGAGFHGDNENMTDEGYDCDLCGKTDVSETFRHRFRRGLSDVTLCAHCLRECAIQFGVYENEKTEYQTTLPKEVEQ